MYFFFLEYNLSWLSRRGRDKNEQSYEKTKAKASVNSACYDLNSPSHGICVFSVILTRLEALKHKVASSILLIHVNHLNFFTTCSTQLV